MDAQQKHPQRPKEDQRKALHDSEKEATREHPETFKDESNAEKVVEIGPDLEDDPIKGIDPEKERKDGR